MLFILAIIDLAELLGSCLIHDDVIKLKHFPRYWPSVQGIHQSPVNSLHKGQWRGALTFFYLRINKRSSNAWWGWWSETQTRPFWRHINVSSTLLKNLVEIENLISPVSGCTIFFKIRLRNCTCINVTASTVTHIQIVGMNNWVRFNIYRPYFPGMGIPMLKITR